MDWDLRASRMGDHKRRASSEKAALLLNAPHDGRVVSAVLVLERSVILGALPVHGFIHAFLQSQHSSDRRVDSGSHPAARRGLWATQELGIGGLRRITAVFAVRPEKVQHV